MITSDSVSLNPSSTSVGDFSSDTIHSKGRSFSRAVTRTRQANGQSLFPRISRTRKDCESTGELARGEGVPATGLEQCQHAEVVVEAEVEPAAVAGDAGQVDAHL